MTKVSRDEKTLDIVSAMLVFVLVLGAGGCLLWLVHSLVGLDDRDGLGSALGTAVVVVGVVLAVAYLLSRRRRT